MHTEILTTENYEYTVGLCVAEYDLEAVWVIFIDEKPVAISEHRSFNDSLEEAERIIDEIEIALQRGEALDLPVDLKDTLEIWWDQFSQKYPEPLKLLEAVPA